MHIISRAKSFRFAANGLQLLLREPNARIHLAAAFFVIVLGLIRQLSHLKWVAIIFAITLVLITEAVNTCIEKLCNLWCDNKWHPEVKIIKDIAAGAVLIAAVISIIIGIIVFIF